MKKKPANYTIIL